MPDRRNKTRLKTEIKLKIEALKDNNTQSFAQRTSHNLSSFSGDLGLDEHSRKECHQPALELPLLSSGRVELRLGIAA
jgi:hypothetical protein